MSRSSGRARSTLAPVRATFRAVVRTVVPAATTLDAGGWARLEGIVEAALAERPARVQRQVVLFLRALRVVARLRLGAPLASVDPERATRFLGAIERSGVLLVRRGFWGVRTLALMGYYGRPEVAADVGYAASLRGWSGRGVGAGPWPGRAGRGAPEPNVMVREDTDIEPPDA
jgi:hypothetical protein